MNASFFVCISSVSLFISCPLYLSLSLHLHPTHPHIFLSLSLPLHPHVFVLRCSYYLSVCLFLCLFPSLALSLFEWRAVSSSGLSCAVICHTSERKKHLLLMLPRSLSFCVSLSQAIWCWPSSQLLSLLFSTSPLSFYLKSPFGKFFQQGSVSRDSPADMLSCWSSGFS